MSCFVIFFICSINQIVDRIFHGNMIRFPAWLWYRSSELRWGWATPIIVQSFYDKRSNKLQLFSFQKKMSPLTHLINILKIYQNQLSGTLSNLHKSNMAAAVPVKMIAFPLKMLQQHVIPLFHMILLWEIQIWYCFNDITQFKQLISITIDEAYARLIEIYSSFVHNLLADIFSKC